LHWYVASHRVRKVVILASRSLPLRVLYMPCAIRDLQHASRSLRPMPFTSLGKVKTRLENCALISGYAMSFFAVVWIDFVKVGTGLDLLNR
jgi:hypothetical protein